MHMRVQWLRVLNLRSIADSGTLNLGPINVVTGANNAGKSTLLRALHVLQNGGQLNAQDVRIGKPACQIEVSLVDVTNTPAWRAGAEPATVSHSIVFSSSDRKSASIQWHQVTNGSGMSGGSYELPNVDPHHFVVPYFSRRKTAGYSEDVREEAATAIHPNMSNLAARLSRLANPHFPDYQEYAKHCEEILGFVVTSIPSPNGQRPGVYLPSRQAIDIDFMGEGVPNIVQLLVHLASSEGKLFLIEEPENDIHPRALRSLLELILKSSEQNQFVISTHSNIVVSHLCSHPASRLWRVQSPKGILPYDSRVEEIEPSATARLQVLNELGYSLADLGLWSGYLVLEESSAEYIIRNYLIPFFAPALRKVRTISASGVTNVEPTFSDLNRLALFLHLEPAYYAKSWVIVDGDEPGRQAVKTLKERFASWPAGAFSHFSQPHFERYYPTEFSRAADEIFAEPNAQLRRTQKAGLLVRVIAWLDEDSARARDALSQSASEVIEHLLRLENELHGTKTDA
jgi:predicted ATPase